MSQRLKLREQREGTSRWLSAVLAVSAFGCSVGSISDTELMGLGGAGTAPNNGGGPTAAGTQGSGAVPGQAGSNAVGAGGAGAGAAPGAGAPNGGGVGGVGTNPTCSGSTVADAKRVVRLSFNQLSNTIRTLFGEQLGAKVDADYEIGQESPIARTFPPLSSPREGSVITTGLWQKVDQIASAVGSYALTNFAQLTSCATPATDTCAQTFVKSFAEKVYRRPLTATETTSILQVYTEVKTIYGTVPEAVQHSVYALMQSPQLLYRTELGTTKDQAGPLTSYELASNLAYFLTDAPPDATLLDAAKQNRLSTPADLSAQVTRILDQMTAKQNLEGAIFSYFQLDNLATVKIDDAAFTMGTEQRPFTGVRESAYRETQLFLSNTLWSGPVNGLLTSRKTSLNTTLAKLYGLTIPSQTDESSFVPVELPANRAGILTQVAFLASNSRPDVPSVVARGLVVNKALLCSIDPPFPEDEATLAAIEDSKKMLENATERVRAEYRAKTAPCLACHRNFDAYGLALDTYDLIGRYRMMDPEGRPIDPSVTLPSSLGGVNAADAVDMQAKIAASPGFTSCVAKNMLNWALAEGSQLTPTSCSTQSVVSGFDKTDKSFSALLREIAVSPAFTQRNAVGSSRVDLQACKLEYSIVSPK